MLFLNLVQLQNQRVAFRLFKQLVEDKYGKAEAKKRIFATTDKSKKVHYSTR